MTDLERWFQDPENPKELAQALGHPAVQKAISLLVMLNLPDGFTDGDAMTKVTQAAHNWHYYAGFHDFHRKLKALSISIEPEDKEPLEAFDPEWLKEWSQNNQKPKSQSA
jgi:hypothetical protein